MSESPPKKLVTEWLDDIDYSPDPTYVPSEFALNFVTLIKLIGGDKPEEHATPVVHYHMLDLIPGNKDNIINLCSRGLSKTTLQQYLILYIAIYGGIPDYGDINYTMYIADSMENNVKKMRLRLERMCDNSDFLKTYLAKTRFTDARWYFKNTEGQELVVTGHGCKSGVRGTVELGTRPQLALIDDVLSDDDARSPTVIASIEDTIYKAVDFALHPSMRKVIWSGTPFSAKDPLYKAVESGAWWVNVFPICNEYPCSREDFKGAWEARFNYDYVKAKYDKLKLLGKVAAFNGEMMLRIMSDEDRLIEDHEINWYSRDTLIKNKGAFNFYITTDFATSEKQAADFSVISVWALDHRGYWFWVDGICKRQTMDKNVDDLFRLAQRYKPQQVGIEVSGQQGGFIPWIQDQMMTRNNFFNLASDGNESKPGIRPNTNKMVRFNLVVPWFKSGMVWLPKEMKDTPMIEEALNELTLVSADGMKSKHDDWIDTVSMLPSMKVWKPSEEVRGKEASNGIWEFDEDDLDEGRLSSYVV